MIFRPQIETKTPSNYLWFSARTVPSRLIGVSLRFPLLSNPPRGLRPEGVKHGCAMLKSRDDLGPVPEGGGRSREEWRGVLSLCSHNVGFNSQDKPGGKTKTW